MKIALVTGTSRGIGLSLVKFLSEKDYKVFAVTRGESPELLGINGSITIVKADVSTEEGIWSVSEEIKNQPLDLLINNAGVLLGKDESFKTMTFDNLTQSLKVNLETPMRLTQKMLPNLLASNHPVVANISSKMGSIADNSSGGYYAYRISKTALNMFNKSFAIDHPQIISLVLHPGWVQTEMGGANALVTPEASAKGLLNVIEKATKSDSGKFITFQGEPIPW